MEDIFKFFLLNRRWLFDTINVSTNKGWWHENISVCSKVMAQSMAMQWKSVKWN
jgi:hypothetical protein